MFVFDLFVEGFVCGWKIYNGLCLDDDLELEVDVVVVGIGVGGGIIVEIFSVVGLKVLLVEEGLLKISSDFKMQEVDVYFELYQEGIGWMSKDGVIIIFQGCVVGGIILINWISSFCILELILQYWVQVYGVKGYSVEDMVFWFEKMEQCLYVVFWVLLLNVNNDVICLGCEKFGYYWKVILCNVFGCWNFGYCGMGCLVNVKQLMLVIIILVIFDKGGELFYLVCVNWLLLDGDKVMGFECLGMDECCVVFNGCWIRVWVRYYVFFGGGINILVIFFCLKVFDLSQWVGKCIFLYMVNFSVGLFDWVINFFYGVLQLIYFDYF